MRLPWIPLVTAACALAASIAPARSDVLIESVGAEERPARVLIGEGVARIDRSGSDIHVLIDLDRGQIFAVDDAQRYVMDMQSPMPVRPEHGELNTEAVPPPAIRLERRKDGPVIAGFATVHYRVTVEGRHCFDEYLAPAALEEPAIRRFVEATSAGSRDDERRVLIQLTEPERLCEAVEDLIDDHYPRLGIPMRTLDAEARVIHRITRIVLDAPHDPALLRVPADYEVLTRTQLMERAAPPPDGDGLQERQRNIERHMRDIEPGAAPGGF